MLVSTFMLAGLVYNIPNCIENNGHSTLYVSFPNLADVDHLLPEELSCAHTVLAPVGAQHLVHHLVRLYHAHCAHHLWSQIQ